MAIKTITAREKRATIEKFKVLLGIMVASTWTIGLITLGILFSLKGTQGFWMTIGSLCIFIFFYKFTESVDEEIKILEKTKTVS